MTVVVPADRGSSLSDTLSRDTEMCGPKMTRQRCHNIPQNSKSHVISLSSCQGATYLMSYRRLMHSRGSLGTEDVAGARSRGATCVNKQTNKIVLLVTVTY